jgi:hypothetical protein
VAADVREKVTTKSAQRLIEEIEQVFPKEPYRHIHPLAPGDWGDYEMVSKSFLGKNWWNLDYRFLKSVDGSATFMTDHAIVYFAPGYMIASLAAGPGADTIPGNFAQRIASEDLLKRFSTPQRKAIRTFMVFWNDFSSAHYKRTIDIINGLEQAHPPDA